MQVESLLSRIRTSALNVFQQLKTSHLSLPDELNTLQVEVIYVILIIFFNNEIFPFSMRYMFLFGYNLIKCLLPTENCSIV